MVVARRSARYTLETRERAVALVLGGVKREKILREIGCTGESLRLWLKKAREKLAKTATSTAPAGTGEGSVADIRPVPAMAATPGPTSARATAKAPSEDYVTAAPPLLAPPTAPS